MKFFNDHSFTSKDELFFFRFFSVLTLLSQFAWRYLAIQASSAPSERLLSKAGQIVTPQRAQLKPDKANMLVFLAENL